MTKGEVENLLETLGWQIVGEPIASPNGSKYQRYTQREISVYLGDYFIEVEAQGHALPWKDPITTKDELIEFLRIN